MPPIRIVKFEEEERKWILSDPGEISASMDGGSASSMFIESQSSLDLMLGMQKNPSWEYGCPHSSRSLETKISKQTEMDTKALNQKRKRKSSWVGGFKDNKTFLKSDYTEGGFVNGEQIGYSPTTENVCNLQIEEYLAKAKKLMEDLQRSQNSNVTGIGSGTNWLLPPKRSNIVQEKKIMKNEDQVCGEVTRHKMKGPNLDSSLPSSRLKKRLKRFQASEIEENVPCREYSETLRQFKVSEKTVDLLMPNDDRTEEESFTQNVTRNFLSSSTLANQTSHGDVLLASPSSKENIKCKKEYSTTHVKKNLRVRALRVVWKEPEDSFLAGSLEEHNRAIETGEHHVLENRSFGKIEQTKKAPSSAKAELCLKRATHAEKQGSKSCHAKVLSNGTLSSSSTWYNSATGHPKSTKSEKPKTPSIKTWHPSKDDIEDSLPSSTLKNFPTALPWYPSKYDVGNGSPSSTLKNFPSKHPKSTKSEKAKVSQILGVSSGKARLDFSSATWENTRGVLKPTESQKAKISQSLKAPSSQAKSFSPSPTWENTRGSLKPIKSEKTKISQILNTPTCEAGKGSLSSAWESSTGNLKSTKSEKVRNSQIQNASTDEAGNYGLACSTWENIRQNPKSKTTNSPPGPMLGALTDEAGTGSNNKDSKESQTGCRRGLQAPPVNSRGNGTYDKDSKQSRMNLDDPPTEENCDLVNKGNARVRTQSLLKLFHDIHKQFAGGHKEVDARNIIVTCYPEFLVHGSDSIYGDVPGVEPGDEFKYRVEMDLVGLHHQFRRGIDVIPASKSTWCLADNPKPVSIAACIVVAGGYVDNRDEGDIIIYTGEGGNNHFHDKGPSKDQMLTFGNKALRHSRMLNLSVRVIRKVDIKPPKKPYYRYDGLYDVVDMKKQRSGGQCKTLSFKPLVYKFLLIRKSAREKYKNVDKLWTCKTTSRSQSVAQ